MSEDRFHSVIVNKKDRGFSAATVIPLGATSLVFVSGEVGRDESGKIVSGGFEAEVRQCFANLHRSLAGAGATFRDVVRLTAYVKDLADYAVYSRVRLEIFGDGPWPASSSVGVSDLLLGAKLEVELIAAIAGPSVKGMT
jgi:2-iminobutanoate/2-iminopropanoate deaminase